MIITDSNDPNTDDQQEVYTNYNTLSSAAMVPLAYQTCASLKQQSEDLNMLFQQALSEV